MNVIVMERSKISKENTKIIDGLGVGVMCKYRISYRLRVLIPHVCWNLHLEI